MSKYREEAYGDVLYQSWLDALQEFIGVSAPNFHVQVPNATTLRVAAGTGSAQVGLAIDGLWRYCSATVNASVSGAAGVYDIFAVCGPNDFEVNPSPPPSELDATVYAFALQALPQGTTPTLSSSLTNYRKIGELDWSGTEIMGFRRFVGEVHARDVLTPTAPLATVVPLRTVGAASQSASLQTWESSAGTVLGSVTPTGGLVLSDAFSGTSATLTGNASVSGTLAVGGNTALGGTVTVTGATSVAALSASGLVTASGAGTGLAVTNNATVGGTLAVTGAAAFGAGLAVTGVLASAADITARNGAGTAVAVGAVGPSGASAITFQGGEVSIYRSGAGALTSAAAWTLSGVGTALTVSNNAAVNGTLTVGTVTATTFSGTPNFAGAATGQTAAPGDSTTKLATTAFVQAAIAAIPAGVTSVFGRTGAILAVNGDYTVGQVTGAAPLASPALTGSPTAPTPPNGDNSTRLATTAFVLANSVSSNGTIFMPPYVGSYSAATAVSGTLYAVVCSLPGNITLTGVTVWVNTAVGNVTVYLFTPAGSRVATSSATAAVAGAQAVPFQSPYTMAPTAGGNYYLGVKCSSSSCSLFNAQTSMSPFTSITGYSGGAITPLGMRGGGVRLSRVGLSFQGGGGGGGGTGSGATAWLPTLATY